MKIGVKNLSLVEVAIHRQGSFILRLLHLVFGAATKIFFRRVELYNGESLPKNSGVIFVSNHPNALVDPMLLFVALPRKIAFLAKSTLFKMPVIGYLIKAVGALPLYRQQDAGQDVSKNQETFKKARQLLKENGAIAIFPEGISHNESQLQPLKSGAARIALGAMSAGENPASLSLKIVPVGLFYTDKTMFRSEALLRFGEPIDVFPSVLDENGDAPREAVKELTEKIESGLREVTVNAETEADLKIAHVAEEVFTAATPQKENLAERLEILQNFLAEPDGEEEEKLEKRLADYDRKLDELGLESSLLTLADYSKRFVLKQALLRSWYLVLLSPLAIVGAILHFPAYQIARFLAYMQTKDENYDMASTMKVLSGIVLMPLTWIIVALVLYRFFDWKIALLSIPFSFVCGYVALRSFEEIEESRGWLKAITAFFFKREKFLRLLAERRALFEKLSK